ncbi:MAG: mechanosensitive ion channel family protein [Ignavibacteria bacterium]|nr:mechanosensitive ion channel family protein [Ignavibacteria bacterium]
MLTELYNIFAEYYHDVIRILPKIITAVLAFIIFWFAGNLVKKVLKNRDKIFGLGDVLITNFIASVAKGVIMVVGLSVSLSILGLSGVAGGIVTGAGVSAVILGFAFKNVGENLISGVMLILNRPFVTGDFIEVAGITGTVVTMNLKSTDIRTVDGKMVYIPNTMVINNPLVNYTAEGKRRFDFEVEVDNSVDVDKCREAILTAINSVPEILKEPGPIVTLTALSSSQKLKVYFWLSVTDAVRSVLEINSEAFELSKKNLNAIGIDISNVTNIYLTNRSLQVGMQGGSQSDEKQSHHT